MTRSRKRKLRRVAAMMGLPFASTMLAGAGPAVAQQQPQQQAESGRLEEVLVTAQKREEDLQDVPLQVTALSTETLEELHVNEFADYVKYLPNVSIQTFGPGFSQVSMRGVASGEVGNHSASLPTVGIYLDEQPITTIQGALDVHIYDIARVEALGGPQGTLYGASSQSGTLRIITNKPNPSGFSAAYDLEGNAVDGAGGYMAQGYVNVPIGSSAAVRLVGWTKKDAGYIDNVAATRFFPTAGVSSDSAPLAKDDFNDVDTYGGRAALRVDLNDTWSITPTVMAQRAKSKGIFAFDDAAGDLVVAHARPDDANDRWYQAALTLEGKISNFDMVYAGSYMQRDVDAQSDYADYSFFYDSLYYYTWPDDNGTSVDPTQYIRGEDAFTKQTHELRFTSPGDNRLRFVGGLFVQKQVHDIEQRYLIDDIASAIEVTGWPDTIWLTQQQRVDRDQAIFGELSFDLTDKLTATGGLRFFEAENSLEGFFGYGAGYSSGTGEAACTDPTPFHDAPCINLSAPGGGPKTIKESDSTHRANLAYKFTPDHMAYVTFSRGFRPGGINRRGTLPPYTADFLDNYELGWKTVWNGRFRFNGAFFLEKWDDFQFSILGQSGLTEIKNAAQAEIKGIETDIQWAVTDQLTLSGGAAWLDAELSDTYCGEVDPVSGAPITVCPVDPLDPDSGPEAPEGTELPVVPDFKANLTARYKFPLGRFEAHLQGSMVYEGARFSDLRLLERSIVGELPSYTIADFSFGISSDRFNAELFVANAFDERAVLWRYVQCREVVCGGNVWDGGTIPGRFYNITNQPRTFGIKFGQRF